jgi:mRNA interferase MazF
VKLKELKNIDGVVLSDQVKSLDWITRNAEFITKSSEDIINEVILKLSALIN